MYEIFTKETRVAHLCKFIVYSLYRNIRVVAVLVFNPGELVWRVPIRLGAWMNFTPFRVVFSVWVSVLRWADLSS
jgi:hypothetical protein